MKPGPLISIVVPMHNEAAGIKQFHMKLLMPEIKRLNYELIYVNDGSTDETLSTIRAITKKDSKVRIIDLSKNFGKEIAVTAGICSAKGDATIILDADGQHPPSFLSDFITEWGRGFQVVIGVRNKQEHEGFIKKTGSVVFYRLFNKLSGAKLVPRSTDFRLIDKEVREAFTTMQERSRITRGLIDWLGFERTYIYFDSPNRFAGEATYTISSLVKLAVNSFTSLSLRPLFFFGWVGALLMLLSLLLGIFIAIEQFILGDPLALNITGTAMLSVFVLFLISLILTSQAILSVYIAHVHEQSQSRPLYVVNKRNSTNLHEQ